jgi:hypothetical protein
MVNADARGLGDPILGGEPRRQTAAEIQDSLKGPLRELQYGPWKKVLLEYLLQEHEGTSGAGKRAENLRELSEQAKVAGNRAEDLLSVLTLIEDTTTDDSFKDICAAWRQDISMSLGNAGVYKAPSLEE